MDKYTNERMEVFKIIADFLPPPKDLIFKHDRMKTTTSPNRKK